MGILANIFHKIFPPSHPAVTQAQQQSSPGSMQSTSASAPAPAQGAPQQGSVSPATATPMPMVDVEDILNRMAASAGQPLNWRSSIVDLLKLLGLDSSLQARQALAHELDYAGDTNNSVTLNLWLHREVMNRLAANGGKVPDDLKD
jgi:hypothetical protein